jgi:hypothetical protein
MRRNHGFAASAGLVNLIDLHQLYANRSSSTVQGRQEDLLKPMLIVSQRHGRIYKHPSLLIQASSSKPLFYRNAQEG